MKDLKSFMAQYDLRSEFEKVLGAPHLHTARSWAWKCPFHDDSTPSCHVYKDHYFCFGCEAHGDLLDWWSWSRNVPLEDVIRQLSPEPLSPQEQQRIATEQAERAARELEEKIKEAQKALEDLRKAQSWVRYHQGLTEESRALWRARGIPDSWQDYWKFGYCAACPTFRQSPSLTMPIRVPLTEEPVNVRHRLLSPETHGDKYRPEHAGLPASPFYGDIDLPIAAADRVIVVEGEIKAAVTFLTIDKPLWQVVGIPGKRIWEKLIPDLQGRKDTVIILDPDAKSEAVKMARSIGGAKVVDLPSKIDDVIIEFGLDGNWLESLVHDARFVA